MAEYSSAFFVINELGQVICWQLTKSTSIDEVSSLLKKMKDRLSPDSLKDMLIFVDNCCSLKGKLTHLFGPDISIKLDLFYAVQRLANKAYAQATPLPLSVHERPETCVSRSHRPWSMQN